MWFIQISQLQGDLVIMFSDGLRDNLHDREAVHVFFGNYQSLISKKKNHENPLISVEKHDKSMGPYELNEPSHYNYIK